LERATLKTFKSEELVFREHKVGVILTGVIFVKNHANAVMNPRLIGRYTEGMILGHGESDGGLTTAEHAWF